MCEKQIRILRENNEKIEFFVVRIFSKIEGILSQNIHFLYFSFKIDILLF
jgi:hypothetical protein